MKLSKDERRTLCAAIESAIMNEQEFIRAHTPDYEKQSRESKLIVAKTKRFIARMCKLRKRLSLTPATPQTPLPPASA